VDQILYGEPHPYRTTLSNVRVIDDYACLCSGVAMSCGDGMGSSTQVLVAKRVWASVVMSCLVSY
jgi:hypothetical protein